MNNATGKNATGKNATFCKVGKNATSDTCSN
jgi:hypothetical protein